MRPPYKRGTLWDPVDLFDIVIPRQRHLVPNVNVVLILHVSLMTKITDTLFTISSTLFPWAADKSGGMIDRVTADQPYNGARCTKA